VPLGQADTFGVGDQWTMIKPGSEPPERAINKQLAGGRLEQIFATDHFGDLHGRVVHDHGQVVSGQIIMAPDYKVSEIGSGNKLLWSVMGIDKGNTLCVGDPKTPIDAELRAGHGFVRVADFL
jgi:hypothetical protein